ncbi:MAG: ABC transporter ATP-binding protein [Acidimicrobiales bacterium]
MSKSFSGLVAVSNVSLAIGPGVTALLGPNGAGKSTLLRLLSGQANPTSGKVWVAGGNPRSDPEARARIGLVPQQDGVFERETALDVVKLAAILSGLDHPTERARQALATTEMDPDLQRGVGTFSKGMRQRVKIAQALVHDPLVLMMDEPLNGLDPRQRRNMTNLVHQLGDQGKTILISSHVLEEVERFGSHVVVIAHGRLAAQGDFRRIRSLMEDQPARIRVSCDDVRPLTAALLQSGVITGCTLQSPTQVEVTTTSVVELRRYLPHFARELGQQLREVTPLDDDLESVFRYLVGGPQ